MRESKTLTKPALAAAAALFMACGSAAAAELPERFQKLLDAADRKQSEAQVAAAEGYRPPPPAPAQRPAPPPAEPVHSYAETTDVRTRTRISPTIGVGVYSGYGFGRGYYHDPFYRGFYPRHYNRGYYPRRGYKNRRGVRSVQPHIK